MCGIAGFLAKKDGVPVADGLVAMLQALHGRGPDSTGLSLYGAPHEGELVASIWAGDDGGAEARQGILEAIDRHGQIASTDYHEGYFRIGLTPEDDSPQGLRDAGGRRRALEPGRPRLLARPRARDPQVHLRRAHDVRDLEPRGNPVHARHRPRSHGDRVARRRESLPPVLGAAVRRRDRRPQRPRHELLQEPPHLRDARLQLPDGERHRVRRRLPGRADASRPDARRGGRRGRSTSWMARSRTSSRRPTASASPATASRRSPASSRRPTTGSPSSPRGSRSPAPSATRRRSTRTSWPAGRRAHGRGDARDRRCPRQDDARDERGDPRADRRGPDARSRCSTPAPATTSQSGSSSPRGSCSAATSATSAAGSPTASTSRSRATPAGRSART